MLCTLLAAIAFVVSCGIALPAYGDTLTSDSGWSMSYHKKADDTVCIDNVVGKGASGGIIDLTKTDGVTVSEIADSAFANKDNGIDTTDIGGIVLNEATTTLGTMAFAGSGIKSINIPASVQEIPESCFAGCSALAEVKFEGDSIGYLGTTAFSGCSSLTKFDVPELTSTVPHTSYRIGRQCFYRCSSLETVVYHGNSKTRSDDYIANKDCFDNCDNLKNFVYYCRKSAIPSGTSSDTPLSNVRVYQTLMFYGSEADSNAAENPVYSITCLNSVNVIDAINGTIDEGSFVDSKNQPITPVVWEEQGTKPVLADGQVWGVNNSAMKYFGTRMSNSYNVMPVSADNLQYAWVYSEVIDDYFVVGNTGDMYSNKYPEYYIDNTNKVFGLDKIAPKNTTLETLDESLYTLHYQVESSTTEDRVTTYTYTDVAEPNEVGLYRVRAEGASESNKGTHTAWLFIEVKEFEPSISDFTGDSAATRWGLASHATALKVMGSAKSAVVVPAGDWRNQLIGAALAGASNGIVLVDNGTDYAREAVTAFMQTGAVGIQVVGSKSVIPESASPSEEKYLIDFLYGMSRVQYKTRYDKDSTPQELADQVYSTIKRLKDRGDNVYGNGWGTTAIVASAASSADALPIAQYAYANKAPVFFVQDNGLLSSTDLGYLKNDGFTSIVIAGDSGYVSDDCASKIAKQTSITPTRMLNQGSDSLEACIAFEGQIEADSSTVVIASTESFANVTNGAVLAGARGGTLLTCSGTADSKRIQDYLRSIMAENGQASVANVYVLGDFASVDSGMLNRISNMYQKPQSTSIGAGDSVEIGDFVCQLQSGNTAKLLRVRNGSTADETVDTVKYNGTNYKVTAIDAGAFKDAWQMKTLKLGASVKTLGANACEGLPRLATVELASGITTVGVAAFKDCKALTKATGSNVTAIGSEAFSGCTKLNTATFDKVKKIDNSAFLGCKALKSFTANKVTNIGASAFSGCVKLASASFASTMLTKIDAKAFNGCKALKTLSFKTTKLTAAKVGANAFKNMPKKATVKVPKKKVKAYQQIFVDKGLPKTATVKAI